MTHAHFTQTGPRAYRCNRCPFAFTVRAGQPTWPPMVAHAYGRPETEEDQ